MARYIHGLDRQSAPPSAAIAKQMLDSIGGHWWNIYIGGPNFGGSGWSPAQLEEYVRHGIERFMLTYVGRQAGGTLTHDHGLLDGHEALAIVRRYGYSGAVPICLDVEDGTLRNHPAALDYIRTWCATVRRGGAVPGIYANTSTLIPLHQKADVEFVWVASWISHGVVNADPRAALHMPRTLWPGRGQRAWQHSGETTLSGFKGLNVDINVADEECLAHPPGLHVARRPSAPRSLRKGDHGPAVRQLTQHLSFVRSHATGRPYLSRARAGFDTITDAALKAFQREHSIKPTGILDATTRHVLGRSMELEKARRSKGKAANAKQAPHSIAPNHAAAGHGHAARPDLSSLVADVRRLDAEASQAWKRLLDYERARVRQLAQRTQQADELASIARILAKIEHTLETLVEVERSELAISSQQAAKTIAAAAPAGQTGAALPPAPPAAAATVSPAAPTVQPPLRLEDLPNAELLGRIERYDRMVGASREVLIGRFEQIEQKLSKPVGASAPALRGGGGSHAPDPGARPSPMNSSPPAKVGVRNLQKALNAFTHHHLHGLAPIAVDGKKGPETNRRIGEVEYYLGYGKGQHVNVDGALIKQMQNPGSGRLANPVRVGRGKARREKQKKLSKQSLAQHGGTVLIDGFRVAAWIGLHVSWARQHGWHGKVISGYRTPEYSEHYCIKTYGVPRVEGKCAGKSSNHCGLVAPAGAVDVSEPTQFAAALRHSPYPWKLCNALPRTDASHFSHSGH